jgi:hypothetical protein
VTEIIEVSAAQAMTVVEIDQQVISLGGMQVIEVGYMQPGGSVGDKSFTMEFNSVNSVTVNHNLEKRPAVSVVDTADQVCWADVTYIDDNNVLVEFGAVNSGFIYCN